MSKRMGQSYLTEAAINHHRNDPTKAYIKLEDGVKMAIPRYYKDKIWPITANQKLIEEHPSILLHFQENEKQRKIQASFIEKLQAEQAAATPTISDRDEHEAKRHAIETFKTKHLTRQDL